MAEITHLVMDVDGTLTDSGVYYDDAGHELKKFNTKDGAGMKVAKAAGIVLIVLTGRECEATVRRMKELGVDILIQNVKDKKRWLMDYMAENALNTSQLGYIGDDINDLSAMELCGFIGCPADACREVKEIATYIASVEGGHGAVRDCIEHLLIEKGIWGRMVEKVFSGKRE